MFKDLKIMKTNIITNITNMKTYLKYLCAVLLLIGTSAHAWATTETMDFTQCWGIGTNYESGIYTYGGYAIEAHDAKYTTYNNYWLLQYYSSQSHTAFGGIILPPFDGTVSSITVTAGSASGATPRTISLYVDGELQSTSTGIAASGSYTFNSLSIAAGSTIELRNSSSNNEFHLSGISITHNGTQMGTGGVSGRSIVAAYADGNGTISVSSNPISYDASTTLTATPADGWSFVNWEVKGVENTCLAYYPGYGKTETVVSVSPNIYATTVTFTNDIYPEQFVVVAHFEETTCSNTPTITFASDAVTKKYNAADGIYQAASITDKGSGQTLKYSSSNTSIATINQSSGSVHLTGALGSTTITASVLEDGDYCAAEDSYTLTVEGYDVTYHVKSCVSNKPSNQTNQKGSLTLPTGLSIDGYQFVGWTTNGSYSDSSTPPSMEGASITVTANVDLYAVFKKTSSTFEKMPENTSGSVNTSVPEGDYVICTNYDPGSTARVFTNDVDGNYRIPTDNTEFTFTAAGLSCTNEEYIWHISGTAGNYLIYNATADKYLGATGGDASDSGDRKVRMLDDGSSAYAKWTISQNDGKVPYMFTNTKRNSDSEGNKSLGTSNNNIFFRPDGNKGSYFLFKRVTASSNYTLNPDCDAAEYTVTIRTTDAGCTGTASASGATWSAPVLAPVLAGTSVSINTVACEGYAFDHWEVTSGGASLNSAATTASNSFDMPSANVVLTPVFTAETYTITYKDKGDVAYSGPTPPSPATYTYGEGATLPEVTKSGYIFMGWFAETDCSGTRVNTIAADATGNKTFYAKWLQLDDYRAWCPEPEVHLTGDNVYITSTNGKSVKAVNTLTLNAINLVPGSTVQLSTPAGSGIMFSKSGVKYNATTATVDFTADAGGDITDATVYVHYYPTSAGSGAPADVTVTATYQTNTDYYSTKDVHVRNMPSAFAIAVKQGSNWFALPANMSGATNPAGVPLNVDESSWTAKGPSTLAYELWPVKSTTGDADRYADYGEKVRFSGNSNKGLWASTAVSGNTLNNNAAISAIGTGSATTNYEWNISPTVDGSTWKYTLKMEGQSNFLNYYNSSVWGSYASGINDIYLIPLTTVETADMAVMEWGESEVAFKCAANTTLTKVTINGTEVSPKPSLTSLGGDIYKITGGGMPNLSTLATYAMKSMVIDVSESGTPKQLILTIPFILTSTNSPAAEPKTAVDLRNLAEGSSQDKRNTVIGAVDIVVRNGAQLDVKSEESTYCTFKDLYIYPGGKVHIDTKDLGAKNVYMRGGFSWLEAEKDYRLPQMLVESGKKIEGVGTAGNGIYYDLHLDGSRYYMIAVPKDVPLGSITNEEGVANFTAWVKQYDGEGRTLSPKRNGWVSTITGNTLYRGVGYEMAIKPRVAGRTIGVLRMPLLKATAWTDETECTPSVTAWGVDNPNVSANNRGWNFIGAPFFTSFRSTDENGQLGANMEIRGMVHHEDANGNWTGTWDWTTTSDVKYVTIPQKMYDDYSDVRAKNYVLEAFYPFFIQAATTGNLSFTAGSKVLKAPSLLRTAVREREVDIDFMLSDDNGVSDQAGLTVGNEYSADFDMDDKEKTIVNENYLKVYTMVGEYRTAFNSLPEGVAELPIPVGYIAPKAGYYFFSMVDGNYSEVEHVWLTDYETSRTVDLLDEDYEFETDKGTNNVRFVLNVILKSDSENTATGLDGIDAKDDGPMKFIREDKMFIKQNGVIYDATGKKVGEINK